MCRPDDFPPYDRVVEDAVAVPAPIVFYARVWEQRPERVVKIRAPSWAEAVACAERLYGQYVADGADGGETELNVDWLDDAEQDGLDDSIVAREDGTGFDFAPDDPAGRGSREREA